MLLKLHEPAYILSIFSYLLDCKICDQQNVPIPL
jgi:hypothetical protein